ncbi:hypothetical protein N3K66_001700 [Trichothecium roseum]|uniref:Uncharacterized protein n=1 Tax=Trichothecium roseum TaxID=47278 RepID=A0ACC0VA69_9HYPO|nr:hypothetical protein N3K66_001700 [Trichothecium roseum]
MMAPRTLSDTLTLSNQVQIPLLGFGVYQSPQDVCRKSCLKALELGYRHIDTAQFYANEDDVGQAVAESKLPRSDIFITTKILQSEGSVNMSYMKCLGSAKKLDQRTGYVDLFLVHSPHGGADARRAMWQALEKMYEEEMKGYAKVWPPHVNQIELHPWAQQRKLVTYYLEKITKKHNVSTNQALVRYSLQKGWIPLPKSDNPERIKLNADVYGFSLDESDMALLDSLDQGSAGAIVEAVKN